MSNPFSLPSQFDLLAQLAQAHGTSGRESAIAEIVRPQLDEMCDRIDDDPLGSLIGVRTASQESPARVLLAAHMDEIGLMVTHVDENGFLHVIPLGGWDARTLVSQTVMVHGVRPLLGVVGAPPIHVLSPAERKKAPTIDQLVIDIGLDADEARELVPVGSTATREREARAMGKLITAKSLDDRVGVFVMLEALRRSSAGDYELHAAATVQEEVGLRGAKTVAHRVAPHIGIAIDTCPSGDGPGMKGGGTKLGEGAAIRIMDASAIGSTHLVEFMESVAEKHDIPHQFHASNKGGTDTQSLQLAGEGSLAGCISIPQRYGHSSVEAVHADDVEAAIALLAAVLDDIDQFAHRAAHPGVTS